MIHVKNFTFQLLSMKACLKTVQWSLDISSEHSPFDTPTLSQNDDKRDYPHNFHHLAGSLHSRRHQQQTAANPRRNSCPDRRIFCSSFRSADLLPNLSREKARIRTIISH